MGHRGYNSYPSDTDLEWGLSQQNSVQWFQRFQCESLEHTMDGCQVMAKSHLAFKIQKKITFLQQKQSCLQVDDNRPIT